MGKCTACECAWLFDSYKRSLRLGLEREAERTRKDASEKGCGWATRRKRRRRRKAGGK